MSTTLEAHAPHPDSAVTVDTMASPPSNTKGDAQDEAGSEHPTEGRDGAKPEAKPEPAPKPEMKEEVKGAVPEEDPEEAKAEGKAEAKEASNGPAQRGPGSAMDYVENNQITVFHDPDHFNVKHPLMHAWTLWFTKPPVGKGDNWNELLREIITFDSVEEFWGVYNNITPTSQLAVKSDYHLFKRGIRPEWEDTQNKHGGKWAYMYKEKRNVPIDELWLHTMLAAIGETLEDDGDGEVMGVVVNVRKGFYRIGLWTRTVGKPVPGGPDADVAGGRGRSPEKGKEILMAIGKRFKEALDLDDADLVEFSGHTDSAASGSSRAKAKLSI
ncbi:MAG: eukaryotic translation initiation factor 4E [Phylliscum demangeonii]|nr:MAG: eukaryotic translation initiation factor 4E [Phylliscum demangeonii]